uniref:peptidylprolyl isomerase n=1 Tax=Arcella intermedia TaxID=1963864 RepID=A0A6B2LT96_9EUKA
MQYKVLHKGHGTFHPTVDSNCECHYRGTLIDGTEFDSSYKRGRPATFAPQQVIKGTNLQFSHEVCPQGFLFKGERLLHSILALFVRKDGSNLV